ncbi:MAG TPA: enolase C-terminal domain-like protein [Solirubrobacteraceae bacterium]|jgi:L-alanine-DL-glutamate epimerase-like enolase superfamily enzyme|nr:enolase C-terminal domain-like protein [Solirubrobacteraceae bacterium]
MKLTATVDDVRLTDPLRPAAGSPQLRPLIHVTVEAVDGSVGHGEAAPLEAYDGVSVDRVLDALAAHTSLLATIEWPADSDVRAACADADPLPQALAAVDLALWDLAGHRAGKPVAELMGSVAPDLVAVNATIGAVEPAAAALEAVRARDTGFGCIKVKVGTPDDRQRLSAIRQAVGPDMLLRVDANGAWTQLDAPERIRALSKFGIELFEEPVHGIDAVQAVSRAVPGASLAVDETAGDATGLHGRRACDAVCLKIAASGGITGLIRDAKAARAVGYEVYIASTLDGPLGIAAALHAAAVVKPDRHCGLATLGRFDRSNPLEAAGGHMRVPAEPGLGDGLVRWYLQ